jgi:hypothetical protein
MTAVSNVYELVDSERLAAAALDDIGVAARTWQRRTRRPPAMTARDALITLQFEALLVGVAASGLANGTALTEEDHDRLILACSRITAICDEVTR